MLVGRIASLGHVHVATLDLMTVSMTLVHLILTQTLPVLYCTGAMYESNYGIPLRRSENVRERLLHCH